MTRRKQPTMTPAECAAELLAEFTGRPEYHPHRAAFIAALEARGTDARTAQFKHYDKVILWMMANWSTELDVTLGRS